MNYIVVIKYATLFFPFFALLFTLPFILTEYHKYGGISKLKSFIIYMFIYYLICAYFLVILPLPKISEVAKLTTPRTQLIPFTFIIDFIKHSSLDISNTSTYITAIKEMYFYGPVFNIILTIPFGIFLRYLFKCDLKKTIFYSFLLSLFFEITQLTGLYFIYPRSYRLFDVDDLILNTLGGLLGYYISKPFIKLIPSIKSLNSETIEKSKIITGFRRSLMFSLDLFIVLTLDLLIIIFIKDNIYINLLVIFTYYFIIPLFLDTSTLGQKFLKIKVLDYQENKNINRLILRKFLFIIIYILIPIATCSIILNITNDYIKEFIGLIIIILILIFYLVSIIKYVFTKNEMLYERISRTKLVSTISLENAEKTIDKSNLKW